MKFPETTTYEVWYQIGGGEPHKEGTLVDQSREGAERAVTLMQEKDKARRPEAAPIHYFVVCAHTTRREVH